MSSRRDARLRLLREVLCESDLDAFRERSRAEAIARLARAPAAKLDLLDDVLAMETDGDWARAAKGRAIAGVAAVARRRRSWVAACAAAAVVVAAIAVVWRVRASIGPDRSPDGSGARPATVAAVPTRRWLVTTRAFTPLAVVRTEAASPARVVGTQVGSADRRAVSGPSSERAAIRTRSHDGLAGSLVRAWGVERLDDDALLRLLPGKPCAILTAADGRRELRLLDPRDEHSLVGHARP